MAPTDPAGRRRVVVVDDSIVQRRFLRGVIAADPQLALVGEAGDGLSAVALVERLSPDVVLMDLHLPKLDGVEAITRLMAVRPTPVIVYSAFVSEDGAAERRAALAAGAADVLAKPGSRDGGRLEEYADELRRRLRAVGSSIPPRRRGAAASAATDATQRPARPQPSPPAVPHPSAPPLPAPPVAPRRCPTRVVAVGASSGGPAALAAVLGALPAGFPAAVLVVQHMAEGFIDGLAGWLDGVCPLPVEVAADGRRLQVGTVMVAPNGCNVVVDGDLVVRTEPPGTGQYHVPGIDPAFISVAHRVGEQAVGVLLTGMGRDGALGLKAMHDRGAFTIAQDAASCAVYGMPAAAMSLRAVDRQLPLQDIAPALTRLVAAATTAVTL